MKTELQALTAMGETVQWQEDLGRALDEIRLRYPGDPPVSKTVYIVRHAQSASNVASKRLDSGELKALADVARLGFDSPLSQEGCQQLVSVRPAAQQLGQELEAVLFSPLQRARRTALELFGEEDERGGFQQAPGMFWRCLAALKEKRGREHMQHRLLASQSILDKRAEAFITFLAALPWSRFAIVGHGDFSRHMLRRMGQDVQLANANILRVELTLGHGGLNCGSRKLVAWPYMERGPSKGPSFVQPARPSRSGPVPSTRTHQTPMTRQEAGNEQKHGTSQAQRALEIEMISFL